MTPGSEITIEQVANGWIVREFIRESAFTPRGQELVFAEKERLLWFVDEHFAEKKK